MQKRYKSNVKFYFKSYSQNILFCKFTIITVHIVSFLLWELNRYAVIIEFTLFLLTSNTHYTLGIEADDCILTNTLNIFKKTTCTTT